MTRISERTVLFADLRGSTSLYETLGNAEATSVVTHTVTMMARTVPSCDGQLIKTLGDGLMAVFDSSESGLKSAAQMHDELETLVSRGREHGASAGLRGLRLQVALARGEVVEMAGDCFGDAVNVAARLLDHAGDNETLVTAGVLADLPASQRERFRSLDWMHLRGRAEPVQVHVLGLRRHQRCGAGHAVRPGRAVARPRGHPPRVARPGARLCGRASAGGAGSQPAGAPSVSTTPRCRARMRESTGPAAPSSSPT